MTIRTRTPLIFLLAATTVVTVLAAPPQRAVISGPQDAPLTATVPVDPRTKPHNVEVLSVAGILAETIQNVFADDSVSAIFAGENQLF